MDWFLNDYMGSTTLTINNTGARIGEQKYDAYGKVRSSSGSLGISRGYTGQYLDAGTGGLMYYNARYYAPYLNRWLQPDTDVPAGQGPQALNRYSYVLNSPLKYTDPSGHRPCDDTDENGQCITIPGWNKAIKKDLITLSEWGIKMQQLCETLSGGLCGWSAVKDLLGRVLTREWESIDSPSAESHKDLLAHATTHTMYLRCEASNGGQPCSGLTLNAVLNWLGEYSSVAKSMYAGGRIPRAISTLAQYAVTQIFNAPVEWMRSQGVGISNEPGYWGNASLFPHITNIEEFLTKNGLGTPPWTYGQRGQDLFYVFTIAQGNALAVEEAKRAAEEAARTQNP